MEERKRKRWKRLKSHGGVEQRSALEDEMASPPLYRNGEENQSSPSLCSRICAYITFDPHLCKPWPTSPPLDLRPVPTCSPSPRTEPPSSSRPLCSRNPQEFHFVCQPNYTPQFYTFPSALPTRLHPSPNLSFGKDGRKNSIAPFFPSPREKF